MDAAEGQEDVETTIKEPAQRIGKFALIERLGRGSSGTVYKALDTFSGQEVALKVLDESLFTAAGLNESHRQQFMNEASLAGRLQHPHIAAILEAVIDEKSGYIAVEYVPGGDLSHAIQPGSLLKVDEVFEIAFKCCGALDYAHRLGIIHRDIKPANLMLAEGVAVQPYFVSGGLVAAVALVVTLGPLALFIPHLQRTRVAARRDYGQLAIEYGRTFHRRWMGPRDPEELVGTPDLRSFTGMANVYVNILAMKIIPFGRLTVIIIAAVTVAPIVGLLLIEMPVKDVALGLVRLLMGAPLG